MAFWGRLALVAACFVVVPFSASATTPGYPPQILEVGADRPVSGEADPFQGGCPWDPASGVRGTAFVAVCQADPLEPAPPYEVVRSRSPFRTMQMVVEDTANYLREPAISPNGRWIAFDSLSSAGTPEVDLVGV